MRFLSPQRVGSRVGVSMSGVRGAAAHFVVRYLAVRAIRMLAVVAAVWFSPPGVWLIPLAAAFWLAPHGAADTR